jgi:hypothetical protein
VTTYPHDVPDAILVYAITREPERDRLRAFGVEFKYADSKDDDGWATVALPARHLAVALIVLGWEQVRFIWAGSGLLWAYTGEPPAASLAEMEASMKDLLKPSRRRALALNGVFAGDDGE